ncbi:OpgC domain-containing protein [Rubinisphaera margarita]|uniref:OpgC domain-containing protein n=1 Tax=Rubinisphaera margarita TaxID=2909586 RepID=UPI0036F20530
MPNNPDVTAAASKMTLFFYKPPIVPCIPETILRNNASDHPIPPSGRLVSVDFFRGLALIIVMLDHIDWLVDDTNIFLSCTPIAWGYSDVSEVFISLSGYTFGYIYSTRLIREPFHCSLARVLRRSLQIYATYVLLSACIITVHRLTNNTLIHLAARISPNVSTMSLAYSSLTLQFQPFCLQILAVYCIILPPMLGLLRIMLHRPGRALCASAIIYVIPPLHPGFNLPTIHDHDGWFFNPFAWQFLFAVSMWFGAARRIKPPPPCLNRQLTAPIALACVAIIAYLQLTDRTFPLRILSHHLPVQSWLDSKTHAGPLRLFHLCLLVHATHCVSKAICHHYSTSLSSVTLPFRTIGRTPLRAYAFGTALTYIAYFLTASSTLGTAGMLILGLDASLLLLLFCGLTVRKKNDVI